MNLETHPDTERTIAEYSRAVWVKLRRDPVRQTVRIVRRQLREWQNNRSRSPEAEGSRAVSVPPMLQPPPLKYAGHQGPWFDDYFLSSTREEVFGGARYVPVLWANFFAQAQAHNYWPREFGRRLRAIEKILAVLARTNEAYFTLLGIYDFPIWNWHLFPKNVVVFTANGYGDVAIPLLSVDRPLRLREKNIRCSFLGRTETHDLRSKMQAVFRADAVFDFGPHWERIMGQSVFSLCPRGQGPTSLRIHEALSLGSIPVYIWENWKWLPYEDELDWNSMAIVVEAGRMESARQRILSILDAEIGQMQEAIARHYAARFSYEGVRGWILSKAEAIPNRPVAEGLAARREEAVVS